MVTFVDGPVSGLVHAADLNALFKVIGAGTAYNGTAPAISTAAGFLLQAGRIFGATADSNGQFTITFPAGFPSGFLACLFQPDGAGNYGVPQLIVASPTAATFRMYNLGNAPFPSGAAIAGGYVAVGF